jgi:hypothetical protein
MIRPRVTGYNRQLEIGLDRSPEALRHPSGVRVFTRFANLLEYL